MAIKDSEYEEILKMEVAEMKAGPKARGINSSIVNDDDDKDEDD